MDKKTKKIIVGILLFIVLLFFFSQVGFAEWTPNFDALENGEVKKAGNRAIDIFGSIINITQVIGVGIAILVLVIVAIQYVVAAPSEKAAIKTKATNYIIGAVLIFSAAAILEIIKLFMTTNVKYD